MKTVLITGATSGFGWATAAAFLRQNHRVIITGRRQHRLQAFIDQHKEQAANILPLCFDVRNREEVEKTLHSMPDEWKNIHILVNNAGLSRGLTEIQNGEYADWEEMIDTNIKGLLYVSKVVINFMIERGIEGHIINVGSTAGHEVYPKGNVYCATKHAVDAITKGMRLDLLAHNIKVSTIDPGMSETEFSIVRFHGDVERAKKVYEGFEPLRPEDIAQCILFMANAPKHVNVAQILLLPAAQANTVTVKRNL
ncbi:MAG: SDR family NAD(P)-dependent oxidoreductase [Bacteroidia bacterium]|nr:SDR family NAD(P)-dependent oxidoreductase [Bacteroidia bacterium]MDW8303055.1 SDR family NAD(P)-dependent oxidoreductase [Bacteroidia bacterium]